MASDVANESATIYAYRVILKSHSIHFPLRHWPAGLRTGEPLRFLWNFI